MVAPAGLPDACAGPLWCWSNIPRSFERVTLLACKRHEISAHVALPLTRCNDRWWMQSMCVCVGPKLHHPCFCDLLPSPNRHRIEPVIIFCIFITVFLFLICSEPVQVWPRHGAWRTLKALVSLCVLLRVCIFPQYPVCGVKKSVFIDERERRGGRRVGGKKRKRGKTKQILHFSLNWGLTQPK